MRFIHSLRRPSSLIAGFLVVGAVLAVSSVYTFSTEIHGDGQYHELIARQVLERGWPLDENRLFVMDFEPDGTTRSAPINYPETVYLLYAALLWISPVALQFSSPLFASLTALLLFLLLKPIGNRAAAVGAVFAVVFNLRRFLISPIIEQPLLTATVAALLFFVLWLERRQTRYALLAGIFAGVTMSLKQQGLLIGPLLVATAGLWFMLPRMIRLRRRFAVAFIGLLVIAAAITLPFQLEHLQRNGTIGYVPGSGTSGILDRIPLVNRLIENKYPADPDAARAVASRLGYRTSYQSSLETVVSFFAFPYRYDANGRLNGSTIGLAVVAAGLVALGGWRLSRLSPARAIVLSVGFILEVIFTHLTQSSIWQYHVLGIAVIGALLGVGLVTLARLARRLGRFAPIGSGLTVLILFSLTLAFVRSFHVPNFRNSGRQDPESIRAYQELGAYINANLDPEETIIAGGTNIVKYGDRKRFWISNGGGASLPEIYDSPEVGRSYTLVRQYPVNYLLIDEEQTERNGLYDSIIPNGLNRTIDSDEGRRYFVLRSLVRRSSGPALRLYEIRAEPLVTETASENSRTY